MYLDTLIQHECLFLLLILLLFIAKFRLTHGADIPPPTQPFLILSRRDQPLRAVGRSTVRFRPDLLVLFLSVLLSSDSRCRQITDWGRRVVVRPS